MRARKYMTPASRILANVTIDANGCWIWQRSRSRNGYGRLAAGRDYRTSAHRFSYETFVGPIPEGLQIDHLCRNRACANPNHLEPVTCRENVFRSPIHLAPVNAAKTHCVHGHEYTPENTARNATSGHRYCKTCSRDKSRRYAERRAFRAAGIEVAA